MNLVKAAAGFIGFSAVLHLIAPLLSDFSSDGLVLLPFAFIYGFLAWMVSRNTRWAMWLSFLLTLFFGIAGMSGFLSPATVPGWVSFLIWVADWLAAGCLFLLLWNERRIFE